MLGETMLKLIVVPRGAILSDAQLDWYPYGKAQRWDSLTG
jgi:hypothetical protein